MIMYAHNRPAATPRLFSCVGVIILLTLVTIAPVFPQGRTKRRPPTIQFDRQISGVVPTVGPGAGRISYRFEVSDEAFGVRIELANAQADLDIVLYDGNGELATFSETTMYNETLAITRLTDPELRTGTYGLDITYQYNRPPVIDGVELTEIPFEMVVHGIVPAVRRRLRPGQGVSDTLLPEDSMVALYEIEVPIGTRALRLDVTDTTADLDIFINRDRPTMTLYESDYWSQSVRSTENIIIDRNSSPPLRPGTYYAVIIDQIDDTYETDFALTVHDEEEAPHALLRHVEIPTGRDGIERALDATVELLTFGGGGSGVLVSPDGFILTNHHVIVDESGEAADEITVGFTLDAALPAEELFLAEVVESAPDRDLALLRIVSGRYGQELRPGSTFPYLEIRNGGTVGIGDDLRFIGYPSIGGTGSRATITLTRGTVAGFQRVPFGTLIKTDGEINEGNSGGAALDSELRLVGLPTEVVGFEAGQIAYVYPVSAIPPAWLSLIGVE